MPALSSVFRFPRGNKQEYKPVGNMSEPYDEAYSIKALLAEETSSDSSSSEHLPPYRLIQGQQQQTYYHRLFLGFNIVFFCFSAFIFVISTTPVLWPGDRFNNTLLRQTSEHCWHRFSSSAYITLIILQHQSSTRCIFHSSKSKEMDPSFPQSLPLYSGRNLVSRSIELGPDLPTSILFHSPLPMS